MFNSKTMVNSARRAAFVAMLAGVAVVANAGTTFTEFIATGYVSGSTYDTVLSTLPKFDPSLGTLVSVTVGTAAGAGYSFSETNSSGTTPEDGFYNVYSEADITITSDLGVVGNVATASDGAAGDPTLAPSETVSGTDYPYAGATFGVVVEPPFVTYTTSGDLAQFIAAGTDNTLSVVQNLGNSSAFGSANLNQQANLFSGSQGFVEYTYTPVPAPAAAGTMLIGLVGAIVRRRKA